MWYPKQTVKTFLCLLRSNHSYQLLIYPSRNILSLFSFIYFSLTNNDIIYILLPFFLAYIGDGCIL